MNPEHAHRVARLAHEGQTDKIGRPYIEHPERVARNAAVLCDALGITGDDRRRALVVEYLHDVTEDCPVSVEDLAEQGADAEEAHMLRLLDRSDKSPYHGAYLDRILGHRLASVVKLADVRDNTDPDRLALLDDDVKERLLRKYLPAEERLSDRLGLSGPSL